MTMTDAELRDALAPLGELEPTDEEIRAVLAAAPPRRRRARRPVVATMIATAAAGAVLVALPAGGERETRASGVALLRAASATAAAQPEPAAFAGYRYTEVLSRWRYGPLRGVAPYQEFEQRVEQWVDRDWRGRSVGHRGRLIEGRLPRDRALLAPFDRPYAYGDAPKAYVDRLPTDPAKLRAALIESMRTGDWLESPGDPVGKEAWVEYHLVRRVLLLLQSANTTPQLRAGLWGVLATAPGVRAAPDARDPLGRAGQAVRIPAAAGYIHDEGFTVVFDPQTSELLYWSLLGSDMAGAPSERHTILRAAHVHAIGDR